jgi:hypothetical protein
LYFLDETSLRRDLVESRVSSTDFAIYLFLVFGIQFRIWYPVSIPSLEEFIGSWIEFSAYLASKIITIGGFLACFRANGGSLGEAFVERFVAFAWVCLVQLTLVAVPFYLATEKYAPQLVDQWYALIPVVLHLAFYLRLWLMIRRLSADIEHAV